MQIEVKTALKLGKQVYVFIEKNVYAEYETYLLNKDKELSYKYVDDVRIYKFIEEIKNLPANNNIKDFETATDIIKYLKEQFAGLFQRFLQEQTRIKEINLIKNLKNTANTLNQLVNYLSEENKDKTEEVNTILMINHPLVEKLTNTLQIPYKFYIMEISDLDDLLTARQFKAVISVVGKDEYITWVRSTRRKDYIVKVNINIFGENDKLKFFRKSDWQESYFTYEEIDKNVDDDLPF